MSAETIKSVWLIVTVITTLTIGGCAVYLWRMFKLRFFRALALLLVAITVEQICAEIKNYYTDPIEDLVLGFVWLAGRAVEAAVGSLVLAYLVLGRNGDPTN